MSRGVFHLRDDLTAAEAVELLAEHEISGAPVLDTEGKVVGVVSVSDLAGAGVEDADVAFDRSDPNYQVRGWEDQATAEEIRPLHVTNEGKLVRDLANAPPVTVDEDATAARMARLMVEHHIHRLLVVEAGRLAGIVTSHDLLRLLAHDGPEGAT